jgi:hypothetical protein
MTWSRAARCDWDFAKQAVNFSIYPSVEKQRIGIEAIPCLRIPTKPAMHSNLKPATCSDPKPAGVPI